MTPSTTVVIVAYGVTAIDLDWIPADIPVVIVHNDDLLADTGCRHPRAAHIHPGENVGFGAGVNLALVEVITPRVLLCNPDTVLTRAHFEALSDDDDAIVAVPLVEDDGAPNAVVSPYWNVPAFMATAWRLGRFVPRGGRLRGVVTPVLGAWGRGHHEALVHRQGEWSIRNRWVSGAVLSISTDALRSVGGFDEDYFLYFEDADLHQRLAKVRPDLRIRLADVEPAIHRVGGSVVDTASAERVKRQRRASARTYASRQPGLSWRVAERLAGIGAP